MPLNEHVYSVAVTVKMTEYSNESASYFALGLNISPRKVVRWFRRLHLWATGDWQLHQDNVPTYALHLMQSFLVKHHVTQVAGSAPLQPRLGALWLLAFPKTKNHLGKGRDFRPSLMRLRKIRGGSWWWLGELVPRGLLWKGLRCHCPMYNISCIFFNECLYFS